MLIAYRADGEEEEWIGGLKFNNTAAVGLLGNGYFGGVGGQNVFDKLGPL